MVSECLCLYSYWSRKHKLKYRGSIHWGAVNLYIIHKVPLALEDQPASCSIDNRGHWSELHCRSEKLTTHLHKVLRLRMCVELYYPCLLCFREVIIMQKHHCCSLGCGYGGKSEVTVHFAIHMSFLWALTPLCNVNQVTKRKTVTTKAAYQSIPIKSSGHILPSS